MVAIAYNKGNKFSFSLTIFISMSSSSYCFLVHEKDKVKLKLKVHRVMGNSSPDFYIYAQFEGRYLKYTSYISFVFIFLQYILGLQLLNIIYFV